MFLMWHNCFPNNKKLNKWNKTLASLAFSGTVISTLCFRPVVLSICLSFFLHNLITFFFCVLHSTMLNQQIRLLLEDVPNSYRFKKDCVVISINEKSFGRCQKVLFFLNGHSNVLMNSI